MATSDAVVTAISPRVDIDLPDGTSLVLSGVVLVDEDREEQIKLVMEKVISTAVEIGVVMTQAELASVSTEVDKQLSRVLDE